MAEKKLSLDKAEKAFIKTIWSHYRASGRDDLPWRKTQDPYKIVVSELMLQQTQVVRVIPKYKQFLRQFPTTKKLATSPLGDVLIAWQGLGYNRRAKFLWQAAQAVVSNHAGRWPKTYTGLQSLPGIGSYTAGAVMNFAYNEPIPLIETNVRTVYIHHFFPDKKAVLDKELLPIIERTLDRTHPREWNWALMDYGAHLKSTVGNVSKQSQTYKKQSDFKTSNRYVRGAIMRTLLARSLKMRDISSVLSQVDMTVLEDQLTALTKEGLIVQDRSHYRLP